jgi:hypothetical protein
MVSFTAAKTSRIFDVSVACVRLHMLELVCVLRIEEATYWGYRFRCARLT